MSPNEISDTLKNAWGFFASNLLIFCSTFFIFRFRFWISDLWFALRFSDFLQIFRFWNIFPGYLLKFQYFFTAFERDDPQYLSRILYEIRCTININMYYIIGRCFLLTFSSIFEFCYILNIFSCSNISSFCDYLCKMWLSDIKYIYYILYIFIWAY